MMGVLIVAAGRTVKLMAMECAQGQRARGRIAEAGTTASRCPESTLGQGTNYFLAFNMQHPSLLLINPDYQKTTFPNTTINKF